MFLALATAVIPTWRGRSADVMHRAGDATVSAAASQPPPVVAFRCTNSFPEFLGRIDGSMDVPQVNSLHAEWYAAALNLNQGGTRSADSLQARYVRWQI